MLQALAFAMSRTESTTRWQNVNASNADDAATSRAALGCTANNNEVLS